MPISTEGSIQTSKVAHDDSDRIPLLQADHQPGRTVVQSGGRGRPQPQQPEGTISGNEYLSELGCVCFDGGVDNGCFCCESDAVDNVCFCCESDAEAPHPDRPHALRAAFLLVLFGVQLGILGFGVYIFNVVFTCGNSVEGSFSPQCQWYCSSSCSSSSKQVATAGVWQLLVLEPVHGHGLQVVSYEGACPASAGPYDNASLEFGDHWICEFLRGMAVLASVCGAAAVLAEVAIWTARSNRTRTMLSRLTQAQRLSCFLAALLASGIMVGLNSSTMGQINAVWGSGGTWNDGQYGDKLETSIGGNGGLLIATILLQMVYAVAASTHKLRASPMMPEN